jgi:hypothetical protein
MDGGERSVSRPGLFTPGDQCIGGCLGPRHRLDALEKEKSLLLPLIESRFLGRPACSLVTIPTELFRRFVK